MKKVAVYLKNGIINSFVLILNLFIRRDQSIILIGSWMGEKFADNSRFLFQYLHQEKQELLLKRVIWVTRNKNLKDELSEMGYEVYLCGSLKSFYWHLKSGVHILCNAIYVLQDGRFLPDIDTSLSFGAKRIQLWHGIAIKSVGAASNESQKLIKDKQSNNISWIKYFLSRGGWADYFLLSTSEKNKEDNYKISRCQIDNIFISSYPRTFSCLEVLPREKAVIEEISKFSTKLIYLPTFRNSYNNYKHPLTDPNIVEFIKRNDILWIEKQHSASNFASTDFLNLENVFCLDENFDVNVLYEHVDVVVSDYSSAVFDAIYREIPVLMYTPDLEEFKTGNVGLLFDLENYCSSFIVYDTDQLIDMINEVIKKRYFNEQRLDDYSKNMELFYDNRHSTYIEFWQVLTAL
ncbi:TPA: CDP-glycerol glycerophosphotransferase family protein [Streptococcus suis]|nr:CDP-glycerol glycerophosphotransferase family protein [Streptococcus suis]